MLASLRQFHFNTGALDKGIKVIHQISQPSLIFSGSLLSEMILNALLEIRDLQEQVVQLGLTLPGYPGGVNAIDKGAEGEFDFLLK